MATQRTRTTYTIDSDVQKVFSEIAKKKAINMSAMVTILIKEWNEKNK